MDRLLQLVPAITSEQVAQLKSLGKLIRVWNEKINVVSRKDIDKIQEHHIAHSLCIAKHFNFPAGLDVLDVGTGGGFPGLPLAIVYPQSNFHLVDSVRKKIAVVESIIDELGLDNCTACCERVEKLDKKFHLIVSRAVAPMSKIIHWTKDKFHSSTIDSFPNQWLFLKGGNLDDEMSAVSKEKKLIALSDDIPSTYFLEKYLVQVLA